MKPLRDASDDDALATAEASRTDGRVTGWTSAALFGVMWAGVPWAAPLAAAAPLAFVLRRGDVRLRTSLVTRWVATVWALGVVCIGLMGARAVRTVPFGLVGSDHARGWLDGAGATPTGPWAMLAASAGFAIAAATTRGLLGCVALAAIVLWTGVTAGVVYARSNNVFEATAVALPLWTLLWVAGLTVALAPLSALSPSRRRSEGDVLPRRTLLVAAALVAAAVLVRLAAAPLYTELAQRLTVQ